MIKVTRLKSKSGDFVINAELIEFVESTPDTVVTLTTGRKFIVEESVDEIMRLVIQYRRECNRR